MVYRVYIISTMAQDTYIKFSRTPHLPWSLGRDEDDEELLSLEELKKGEVICTEKLDGENNTLYTDYMHARSIDSLSTPWQDWMRAFHGGMKYLIPRDLRICGECVYIKHSILYGALTSYFYVFGVFRGRTCLSWDDTLEVCRSLSLEPVPVLYRGPWDEQRIKACWTGRSVFGGEQEGYVVRSAGSFEDYKAHVAKFRRADHVKTDKHWTKPPYTKNIFKESNA